MRRDEPSKLGMLGDSHRAGPCLDFFGITESRNGKSFGSRGLKARNIEAQGTALGNVLPMIFPP
jgi:hypothetical protein